MSGYFDRQGRPMEMMDWARALEKDRTVARDVVGEVLVSTVWVGLDHSSGGGPPMIFETMAFDGPMGLEQERYSTEAEAIAGHARMVERVKARTTS